MRDAKEILNLPVVVLESGLEVGKVRDLLFEPAEHRLYGMVIDGKGDRPKMVLPRDRIGSIGENAVTIANLDQVSLFDSDETAQRLEKTGGHLGGMRVLTEGGNLIGKVDTVMLHEDGRIASYQTSSGLLGLGGKTDIQPEQVVTAGTDAIIIPDASKGPE
jgi:uncharacterized protein YrrD